MKVNQEYKVKFMLTESEKVISIFDELVSTLSEK